MKKVLLFFAVLLMASTGMWAETVDYLYPVYNADGVPTSGIKEWKTGSVDATVVTDASERVTWGTAGTATWYVVTGTDVTLSQGAICQGDVHLILADGAKLTATGADRHAGIEVSGEGISLTIYGQTAQSGQLEANTEMCAAGIGGSAGGDGSNITINGGMVTATSSFGGSGIGGGDGGGCGVNITINGGTVKANSGEGAGIGGGIYGTVSGSGSNITINGGTVTANSMSGAGIGGGDMGSGSNITINGGNVTATSGMGDGIGNGHDATGSSSNIFVATRCILKEVVIVDDEEVTTEIAPDRSSKTDIAADLVDKEYVTVEPDPSFAYVAYIDEKGEEQHVYAKPITSSDSQVTWRDDWYIVTGADVTLSKGAICQTDVHLILADGAKLTATGANLTALGAEGHAGITVSGDGNSIAIYGQAAQSGQLEANGGYCGAGIGGSPGEDGSNITINGGMVTATSSLGGSGIGGGDGGGCGVNITINGGTVKANCNGGAGIGGGMRGSGTNITINGGTVTANSTSGAGIGGGDGDGGSGSDIIINGGNVTATSGMGDGIGNGHNATGSSSNIRVTPTLYVTAYDKNHPTKAIANDGGDIAESLAGKCCVTITDLYAAGKADALGTLGNEQEGPALIVTDQDGKEVILYNPTSVKYIMK